MSLGQNISPALLRKSSPSRPLPPRSASPFQIQPPLYFAPPNPPTINTSANSSIFIKSLIMNDLKSIRIITGDNKPCRINTSEKRSSKPFRINTSKKHPGEGVGARAYWIQSLLKVRQHIASPPRQTPRARLCEPALLCENDSVCHRAAIVLGSFDGESSRDASFNFCGAAGGTDFVFVALRAAAGAGIHLDALGHRRRAATHGAACS